MNTNLNNKQKQEKNLQKRKNQGQKQQKQQNLNPEPLRVDQQPLSGLAQLSEAQILSSGRKAGIQEVLSAEKLKEYPGLAGLTDAKAREIADSLLLFSQLTYELFRQQQQKATNSNNAVATAGKKWQQQL